MEILKKEKNKKQESLMIHKNLPQIIIPKNKNNMFFEWYNKDLRFQDSIPKVFERGYVFIENDFLNLDIRPDIITKIAKFFSNNSKRLFTYREIENYLIDFKNKIEQFIVYFEFENNFFKMKLFGKNDYHMTDFEVDLSKTKEGANFSTEEILNMKIKEDVFDDASEKISLFCFALIQAAFWYIATTTNTTKYKRINRQPTFIYEKKTIINPKKNKTISTPFYDMNKIRTITLDGLIKRRKGWTYSHSFEVRGHYRHYENGKIVFVKPFIKGKGKEQMQQIITLNPKEE